MLTCFWLIKGKLRTHQSRGWHAVNTPLSQCHNYRKVTKIKHLCIRLKINSPTFLKDYSSQMVSGLLQNISFISQSSHLFKNTLSLFTIKDYIGKYLITWVKCFLSFLSKPLKAWVSINHAFYMVFCTPGVLNANLA